MAPFFFGCRCCEITHSPPFCTHRVFTSEGVPVWDFLHEDVENSSVSVQIDNSGRVLSSLTFPLELQFGIWDIDDGSVIYDSAARTSVFDWSWYVPTSDGNVYQGLKKHDSSFSIVYSRNPADYLPVISNTAVSILGRCAVNSTESEIVTPFQRNVTAGTTPLVSAGVLVFSYNGDFRFSIEDEWIFWPTSGGNKYQVGSALYDTSGFLYLFFGSNVTRYSDYGVDVGNVWKYTLEGDFVQAFQASGCSSDQHYIGIISDTLIVSGLNTTVKTFDASSGAVINSIDLSAFGSQITTVQSDRIGSVYVLIRKPGFRQTIVCLDSELNLKWSFLENEDSISFLSVYPVNLIYGLRCSDSHVVFGGTQKSTEYDESQLIIY